MTFRVFHLYLNMHTLEVSSIFRYLVHEGFPFWHFHKTQTKER